MPARSGPLSGFVSTETVESTASRSVARRADRHKAVERENPQGAQPTGIPDGVEAICILARNGERARRSPEWSVASDAEADNGERDGPETNVDQPMINKHPAESPVSIIYRAKPTRYKEHPSCHEEMILNHWC